MIIVFQAYKVMIIWFYFYYKYLKLASNISNLSPTKLKAEVLEVPVIYIIKIKESIEIKIN